MAAPSQVSRHCVLPHRRVVSSPAVFVPPLPRFTLPYLLQSSPPIRACILGKLQDSLQDLLSLRLVNKALAQYASVYLFKEIRLRFRADYWRGKDMTALERIGHNVQRVVFMFKHNQLEVAHQIHAFLDPASQFNTRIPYATSRDYELELDSETSTAGSRSIVWTTVEHLNPVPEIIELHTAGGGECYEGDKEGDTSYVKRSARPRSNIPTTKTGGPPDTSRYGPLYLTSQSVNHFMEFFLRTPNLSSLIIQSSGFDFYWEYSCVDIALDSLRRGAIAAGIRLQEIACFPIHILGLECLCAMGRRFDTLPDAFGFLGWGGLKRVDLAVDTRVLIGAQEGAGRETFVYFRIVRAFFLALGRMGRIGLETLKFCWIGSCGPNEALNCPFLMSNSDNVPTNISVTSISNQLPVANFIARKSKEKTEDEALCTTLLFPNLTRLYIRNVATTADALAEFLQVRATRCSVVSIRLVVLVDGGDQRSALSDFEPLWETVHLAQECSNGHILRRTFSGDYIFERERGREAAIGAAVGGVRG